MDYDLEIINEEDDLNNHLCSDHLFESIMNAMNSMKEATADKIYQKIQRDGETNYSKPQVDKALANALKYGIFEVRNNRYRVKDEILDDEDTVYWKLQDKKERTPFRIQEHISEKQFGLKLDPERDNQRFRKVSTTEMHQCPHCGRASNLKLKKNKKKTSLQEKSNKLDKVPKNKKRGKKFHGKHHEIAGKKEDPFKRRDCRGRCVKEGSAKKKKPNKKCKEIELSASDTLFEDFWSEVKELREKGSFDSRFSKVNLFEENYWNENFKINHKKNSDKVKKNSQSYHSIETDTDKEKPSVSSIPPDTDSHESCLNYPKNCRTHSSTWDSILESEEKIIPTRMKSSKVSNMYLRTNEVYNNQYENSQTDQHKGKSDWLGHSDEPQGNIIQSNNVLTIEPMDSLAFKSPEQATYIA